MSSFLLEKENFSKQKKTTIAQSVLLCSQNAFVIDEFYANANFNQKRFALLAKCFCN
jgi:hypothetical protein